MSLPVTSPRPRVVEYAGLIRRRFWWIVTATALGVLIAFLYTRIETTQYTATAQVVVQPVANPGQSATPGTVSAQQLATDVQLITSPSVKAAVVHSVGHVHSSVSASSNASNNVIAVKATGSSPVDAARTANAFAKAFITYQAVANARVSTKAAAGLKAQADGVARQITALRNSLSSTPGAVSPQSAAAQTEINALQLQENTLLQERSQVLVAAQLATGQVAIASLASPPASPSSPHSKRDIALGGLIGLLVGLGLAVGADAVDDRLRSKEDLVRSLPGVPVLGVVPFVGGFRKPQLVSLSTPDSPAAESFRSVRAALQFLRAKDELRVILLTGPAGGEGTSTAVANLGVALARSGQQTCVVAGDLRRPGIAEMFSLPTGAPGISSVASGEAALETALVGVGGVPGLWCLPGGPRPAQPSDFLSSGRVAQVFADLRGRFDVVLVDSPAVTAVADSATLAAWCDGVLLVARERQTRRRRAAEAFEQIAESGHELSGSILFEASSRLARSEAAQPKASGQGRQSPRAATASGRTRV